MTIDEALDTIKEAQTVLINQYTEIAVLREKLANSKQIRPELLADMENFIKEFRKMKLEDCSGRLFQEYTISAVRIFEEILGDN